MKSTVDLTALNHKQEAITAGWAANSDTIIDGTLAIALLGRGSSGSAHQICLFSMVFRAQVGVFAERYAFVVEWLDANSGITWKYQLLHFPESKEIEMVSDHS